MSRGKVIDAIDAILGTTSHRGGVVRNRDGVFTNGDGLGASDSSLDGLLPRSTSGDVDLCSSERHERLKGNKRCSGCGRTRNEIEIDGE